MRLSQNTLLIVANPFAAPLSAEGRCTALCPADPAEGGGRYVGASTRATVRKQPAGMRSPFGTRDKVSVMYALAPVKVADTSYYRAALKSGDVISVAEVSVMPVGRSKIEVRAEGIAGAAGRFTWSEQKGGIDYTGLAKSLGADGALVRFGLVQLDCGAPVFTLGRPRVAARVVDLLHGCRRVPVFACLVAELAAPAVAPALDRVVCERGAGVVATGAYPCRAGDVRHGYRRPLGAARRESELADAVVAPAFDRAAGQQRTGI